MLPDVHPGRPRCLGDVHPVVDKALRAVCRAALGDPAHQLVQLPVGQLLAPHLHHRRARRQRGFDHRERIAARAEVGDDVQAFDHVLAAPPCAGMIRIRL